LLRVFLQGGAQDTAYETIVATGANACILHHRAGHSIIKDGDLVLIDAGCELHGYASDITRTFPANGRFTAVQAALYDIVLAAQTAAVSLTRPGESFNAGHEAAVKVLCQGLIDEGILKGSLDEIIETKRYQPFYMHRTGHWLGLDVHDVGPYRLTELNGPEPDWRPLTPGMVLTIEPGLYIRPADDVPERFWDIGIRIEDDALVTDQGCELITRGAPVTRAAIEDLMAAAST
jgi:Xaa-Pro aminopeptidase